MIARQQEMIVEMECATLAKIQHPARKIVLQQVCVETGNATAEKSQHVLMIAHLNVLLDKYHSEVVGVYMTVLVYQVHHGMNINNAACVLPNMWTMETANVFIIMFIMVVVVQWVLYYKEPIVYVLKGNGIIWELVRRMYVEMECVLEMRDGLAALMIVHGLVAVS